MIRVLAPIAAMAVFCSATFLPGSARAQATDLLISEYVEGSSSDKAVELFNGTGATIDLGDYQLELYFNGTDTPGSLIALSGSLPTNDAYVIANASASFGSEAYVDLLSSSLSFNGDDALALRHLPSNAIVDLFGRVGFDPGTEWPAPNGGTADNTLRRRETVCRGAEPVDAPFDGADEWDGLGNNVFTGLGSHSLNCRVAINEVLADPPTGIDVNGDGVASTSEDEFVELVNLSPGDIDLAGWTVSDGVGVRHTFPASTIIPSGCGIVVFAGGTPAGEFGGMTVQTASSGFLGLNNGGDTVTLENTSGVVATLTWGSEGGNDQSLTRSPDITGVFTQHTQAQGATGQFSPGTRLDGASFSGCAPPADEVFTDRFEQTL